MYLLFVQSLTLKASVIHVQDPYLKLWADHKRVYTAVLCLILFLMSACNHFPFCLFVTMICQTQKCCRVLWPHCIQLCLPLTQCFFSLELPALIPLVFFLIPSESEEDSLNCISCIRLRCTFFRPWVNQYIVHGFDSISRVSSYDLLSFRGRVYKFCCSLKSTVFFFDFDQIILNLSAFASSRDLLLVYNLVQLSHIYSDFSPSFKVGISETRILCHLLQVLLSSTLMKAYMPCWHYFSYAYFRFGYLVSVTFSWS